MLNQRNKNVLLIFIKNPKKGKVKTRLAESVGEKKALQIYNHLLQITKSITDKVQCTRQVWYSDYIDKNDLWSNGKYEKRLQSEEHLGERMKDSFRQNFTKGYKKVVIIGSDCASLTKDIIENAFKELRENDIVIGPSEDGGYYLLGMSSFYPQLFDDISWSTSDVLDQTLGRVIDLELSYKLLSELNDIDTIEDLQNSNTEI